MSKCIGGMSSLRLVNVLPAQVPDWFMLEIGPPLNQLQVRVNKTNRRGERILGSIAPSRSETRIILSFSAFALVSLAKTASVGSARRLQKAIIRLYKDLLGDSKAQGGCVIAEQRCSFVVVPWLPLCYLDLWSELFYQLYLHHLVISPCP